MNEPVPFVFEPIGEAKRYAPATGRNRDSIGDVLEAILPQHGLVLEIASGTGEHIIHFAQRFPNLNWQPSDPDSVALASIAAWREGTACMNLRPPMQIDAREEWNFGSVDAIICINMVHISPWDATTGLFQNAGRILREGGLLYLYGPYRRHGLVTAASNEAFNESLKSRNPEWGLRSVEAVEVEAAKAGLKLADIIEMPANNLSLIFRRDPAEV